MDGYTIRLANVSNRFSSLSVTETIKAACVPTKKVGVGDAAQLMTGAPVPQGANVVVKIEVTCRDRDHVSVRTMPPRVETIPILLGTSVRSGDCVLRSGRVLSGARIGAFAELRRAVIPARCRPSVAVLATVGELVLLKRNRDLHRLEIPMSPCWPLKSRVLAVYRLDSASYATTATNFTSKFKRPAL